MNHAHLRCELATAQDAQAIAACHLIADPQSAWTQEQYDWVFSLPQSFVVVLRDSMRVVGLCAVNIWYDEAELWHLAIEPAYRGQAWSHVLWRQVQDQLAQHKVGRIFLEVRQSNHRALALYQRWGFVCCGERKDYYGHGDTTEHAWVLAYERQPNNEDHV